MSEGKRITDLQQLESIPEGTSYLAESGDGSGTKRILHEVLLAALIEGIKLGSLKELNTESKDSMVAALNEVLKKATAAFEGTDGIKAGTAGMVPTPEPEDKGKVLGASGKWVPNGGIEALDVLGNKEELEANTTAGKVVDALVVKEINNSLGFDTKLINGVPNWSPRGADTWTPFSGKKIGDTFYKGTETYSIDIKPYYPNMYKNLKPENFFITSHDSFAFDQSLGNNNLTFSYNANTGMLSVSKFTVQHSANVSIAVYYYIYCFPSGVN